MKTITLILSILIATSFFATDRLQPVMMYKVINDTVNNDVPEGKCLITGVVTHLGQKIEKANVFSEKSNNVQTDKEGRFRILIDTTETYLVIHKVNFPETYVEYYKFNNKHHIEIEIYIPEENIMLNVDKPVIYLYGEKNMTAAVHIEPQGDIAFTYPRISDQDNWEGRLSEKGITIDNKVYPYLFYETKNNNLSFTKNDKTIKGSVIHSSEIILFLEQNLTAMNLNSQEQTDFITYWAPRMTQHDKVFVQFWTAADYNNIAAIHVTPEPENLFRVFMVYSPIENGMEIETIPQQFEPVDRTGFTVIEWGGSELPAQKIYSLKTL